jgi:type I restriction enzyme R subunit
MFDELMQLVNELDEEATRHIREKLTEEELAIFDILTRPEPKLTMDEEIRVKTIARQLLEKLKRERLIIDWRVKETARAAVRQTIREELDDLPDVYNRKLWEDKVERMYQFIFERMGSVERQ